MKTSLVPLASVGWAFAVGITGALAATALHERVHMPQAQWVLFVGLGVAMVALALVWRSPGQLFVYWLAQIAAAATLTLGSRGHAALAFLPVLGQSVFYTPRRFVFASAAGIGAFIVWAHRARAPSLLDALALASGHLAGVLFVIAFSLLLLSERDGRRQGEALATARERARLAREIHDILGHTLTAVHAQLSGALAVWTRDPESSAHLVQGARAHVEQSLSDVRRSVAALREDPPVVLSEAVQALIARCASAGLAANLVIEGSPVALPAETSLTLYRAIQECVTNSMRHAGATRIDVSLRYEASAVLVRVGDDGRGTEQVVFGSGLRGVRERLEMLGGGLAIVTAAGAGFELRAFVPSPPLRAAR